MRWFGAASKVAMALVLSMVIWELILRAFIVVPIPYHHDPSLGWMPKPYSKGLYTLEGRGVCVYNEFGFRGEPIGSKKLGELRIVALGDSYTEAQQMDIAQTYPARLEQMLQRAGSAADDLHAVRVLNGGRSATSPAFYVGLAEQYKDIFQPDWVIILVRDGNWPQLLDPQMEIYYQPAGDSFEIKRQWKWSRMSPVLKQLMKWHVRDLAVFQYTYNRLSTIMEARRRRADATTGAQQNISTSGQSSKEASAAAYDDVQALAMDWTLQQFKQNFPRLVLVHMPTGDPSLDGISPPQRAETLLTDACERHQIPLIKMRSRLVSDYAKTGQPSFGFANTLPWWGHPNSHGHELVAQALYDFFIQQITTRPGSGGAPQ